jgi:poly-beta-1,6-N-acetyl-D-glucosamine synthase
MILTILLIIITIYAEMILALFFSLIKLKKSFSSQTPATSGTESLKVSVIVPARNEAGKIDALISSLHIQTVAPQSFEVIIVDDHSTDGTAKLAENLLRGIDGKVVRLEEAGLPGGKKVAIAYGISLASHPLILLTDADCVAEKDWISSFAHLFGTTGCVFAAGLVKLDPVKGPLGAMEALDFYGLIGASAGAAGMELPFMCNAANMAFLKETFLKLDGMQRHSHLSSGDDVFFLHQVVKSFGAAKVKWNLLPGSIITTKGTENAKAFFMQRMRWASKSKSYRNPIAITVAVIVLLTTVALLTATWLTVATGNLALVLLFALKALVDIPLIFYITKIFGQQSLLVWFIPSTVLYPFYTTIIGIASFFYRPTWKGRRIR